MVLELTPCRLDWVFRPFLFIIPAAAGQAMEGRGKRDGRVPYGPAR